MKTVKFTLGKWIPSPSSEDGSMTFRKSSTSTPYYRFASIYGGHTILVILNAIVVNALATHPLLLQGKDIEVEEMDVLVALDRQKVESTTPVLVFTNFTITADTAILAAHQKIEITVVNKQPNPVKTSYWSRLIKAIFNL